ncbi:MAG: hypothetical protein JKY81_10385 [Colwellia sp.]|nr:hypothetical protein [Colwellia sp.]
MKQLISLLLTISIIVISCSSYATNTATYVNSIYTQPSSTYNTMVLEPSLSKQLINENFAFTATKTVNKHNTFFELAIIFNEKLQQFIAFFAHFGDEEEGLVSNNISTADISPPQRVQTVNKKCTKSN